MNNEISILNIIEDTTVDGPGFRTTIYCAGCPNHCKGCHNPESWDINNGQLTPIEDILKVILDDEFADVTFSGGDPMFQPEGFTALAKAIKANSNKNIWCYSGFTFEQIIQHPKQRALLECIDVLVDGRYEENLKEEGLIFRGSSNQRLIDVKATLEKHEITLYDTDTF